MRRSIAALALVLLFVACTNDTKDAKVSYVKETSVGRLGWKPSKQKQVPCVVLTTGDEAVACPSRQLGRVYGQWVQAGSGSAVIGFLAPGEDKFASTAVGVIETTPPIEGLGGRRLFIQIVDNDLQTEDVIGLAIDPSMVKVSPDVTTRRP